MTDDPTSGYLGDGVYATFDGYQIWLSTEREQGMHRIALEPSTMNALTGYADRVFSKSGREPTEKDNG